MQYIGLFIIWLSVLWLAPVMPTEPTPWSIFGNNINPQMDNIEWFSASSFATYLLQVEVELVELVVSIGSTIMKTDLAQDVQVQYNAFFENPMNTVEHGTKIDERIGLEILFLTIHVSGCSL